MLQVIWLILTNQSVLFQHSLFSHAMIILVNEIDPWLEFFVMLDNEPTAAAEFIVLQTLIILIK